MALQGVWIWQRGRAAAEKASERGQRDEAVSSSGDEEDRALLRAARSGDEAALERLLIRHGEALYRLCLGILPEPSDAEDAVQEVFLRLLRTLSRPDAFQGRSTVRTWLFRIAINICIDSKRAANRGGHLPPLSLSDEPFLGLSASTPSPEQEVLVRLRLKEAVSVLSTSQRVALLLKVQQGWSVAEIGEATGWSEKKVHNELYQARRALLRWREGEEK